MNPYLKHLTKIEFVITNACTGHCKHCSEGDHTSCGEHIDLQTAADAVRKIAAEYDIQTVMTFGGEPLLYADAVFAIMTAAKELNIPKRQIITNGYFSKDPARIREVAEGLAESGVNDLLLSVDAFHQETIPLDIVKLFAAEARRAGIPLRLQPAWLVSPDHDNPYNRRTCEILASFSDMGIAINDGNIIFPEGNAVKYLAEYFNDEIPKNPYVEDPRDVRCVSFSPNGDVLGGNIYQRDIMDILEQYRPQVSGTASERETKENRNFLVALLSQTDPVSGIRKETDRLMAVLPALKPMVGFDHCHPHHHLNVWEHTLLALRHAPDHLEIRLALLLHDIGKPVCYQQDGEFRHFKGHPERSSVMAREILIELGFEETFTNRVTELVRRHDTGLNRQDAAADPVLSRELFAVQICDALAHNPAYNKKRLAYIAETREMFAEMGTDMNGSGDLSDWESDVVEKQGITAVNDKCF